MRFGRCTDEAWIVEAAKACRRARLTKLLPGIGAIDDLRHTRDCGMQSVRIAAQHIAAAREMGLDVSGLLMMSRLADAEQPVEQLTEQARLIG